MEGGQKTKGPRPIAKKFLLKNTPANNAAPWNKKQTRGNQTHRQKFSQWKSKPAFVIIQNFGK